MVRIKYRYLLAEFMFPSTLPIDASEDTSISVPPAPALNEGQITSIVRESLQHNFGDVGWSLAGSALQVKYWSPTTKLAIIRTHRAAEPTIRGALFFVRSIKDTDCAVRVLHVGGSIRKTQKAAILFDRRLILKRLAGKAEDVAAASAMSEKAIASLGP